MSDKQQVQDSSAPGASNMTGDPQDRKPTGSLAERVSRIRENLHGAGTSQGDVTPMEQALSNAVYDILEMLEEVAKSPANGR